MHVITVGLCFYRRKSRRFFSSFPLHATAVRGKEKREGGTFAELIEAKVGNMCAKCATGELICLLHQQE